LIYYSFSLLKRYKHWGMTDKPFWFGSLLLVDQNIKNIALILILKFQEFSRITLKRFSIINCPRSHSRISRIFENESSVWVRESTEGVLEKPSEFEVRMSSTNLRILEDLIFEKNLLTLCYSCFSLGASSDNECLVMENSRYVNTLKWDYLGLNLLEI